MTLSCMLESFCYDPYGIPPYDSILQGFETQSSRNKDVLTTLSVPGDSILRQHFPLYILF